MKDVPNQVMLLRYGEPSKLDQASFGTACKVTKEHTIELYLQMSKDECVPNWQLITTLALNASQEHINNEIESFLR